MIGTVLKPQGVRGECKIKSYAADITRFTAWKTLYIKENGVLIPLSFMCERIRDGFVFGKLADCADACSAERYRGLDLYIARSQAAEPEGNAVLIADLVGCSASDESGKVIGILTEVLQYGSVDVWVFKTDSGTLMAPALSAVFLSVDCKEKRIIVCREKLEEVAVRNE